MAENSMIIIGAGFAGLSAGIYARMNGYQTTIYEMHDLPGGLCTAWKREGYTIDGCIHWLVGSSPESGMHRYWQEVGIAQEREFVNLDEYMRYECADGRTLVLYSNVDTLEKHLLEFSPQDAEPIGELISGIRMCLDFDQPSEFRPASEALAEKHKGPMDHGDEGQAVPKVDEAHHGGIRAALQRRRLCVMPCGRCGCRSFPCSSCCSRLPTCITKMPATRSAVRCPCRWRWQTATRVWGARSITATRVEKILVEGDRAVGVRLADGTERRAGRVISAADGYTTHLQDAGWQVHRRKDPRALRKVAHLPAPALCGCGRETQLRGHAQDGLRHELPLARAV